MYTPAIKAACKTQPRGGACLLSGARRNELFSLFFITQSKPGATQHLPGYFILQLHVIGGYPQVGVLQVTSGASKEVPRLYDKSGKTLDSTRPE
jgi:hypothetical protein